MEEYYPYECTMCGNCCRHMDWLENMQFLDRGDGVCKHLTETNLCQIYHQRPGLCNGKYVYETYFSLMEVDEFHTFVVVC